MSFFRSKPISSYQLILPRQNAHRILSAIGAKGRLQLKHSTQPERHYQDQVRICDETLHRLGVIQRVLQKEGLYVPKVNYSQQEYDAFLEASDKKEKDGHFSQAHCLRDIVDEIERSWISYEQLTTQKHDLTQEMDRVRDHLGILIAGDRIFGSAIFAGLSGYDAEEQMSLKCGVLRKKDEQSFRRTVFRISRGYCMIHSMDWGEIFPQESQQPQEPQIAIFLFYGFAHSRILEYKLEKILDNYSITSWQYPQTSTDALRIKNQLQGKLETNKKLSQLVDQQAKATFKGFTGSVAGLQSLKLPKIDYQRLYILHEKKIYEEMNFLKNYQSFFKADVFAQQGSITQIIDQLQQALAEDQLPPPQFIPEPSNFKPSLFDLNKVTFSPYAILKAYGVPHYQESNPAFFNLITFPFLFGVMFGDLAHGSLLFTFGMFLIFRQGYLPQIMHSLLPHRYTIALMGFFSTYCGLIYNQFASLPLDIFGSCYSTETGEAYGCIYPVGVDPRWYASQNGLTFVNSLKMKIAVIIAVIHMTLGLFVKGLNLIHKKQKIFIVLQLIPQIIFLVLLFGYMDFLIVFKWLKAWPPSQPVPSIITTMINIAMRRGGTEDCCGGQPLWGEQGDSSQEDLQGVILAIVLICVPWMLVSKPLYLYLKLRCLRQARVVSFEQSLEDGLEHEFREQKGEKLIPKSEQELEMGQVIVHQLIETIEFVLGCISNTASYLRLWALSLAHSQLSDVFFEKTVQIGFQAGYLGIIENLLLYPIYAGITFGILMCMDSMECFLHTLRLHWVEFQNKFYLGDGQEFEALDFRRSANEWLAANSEQ